MGTTGTQTTARLYSKVMSYTTLYVDIVQGQRQEFAAVCSMCDIAIFTIYGDKPRFFSFSAINLDFSKFPRKTEFFKQFPQ